MTSFWKNLQQLAHGQLFNGGYLSPDVARTQAESVIKKDVKTSLLERHGASTAPSANRGLPVNPGTGSEDLEEHLNHRGHAEHEGSGYSRVVRQSVMPCASPSGLLAGNTREHVGKRYLSFFPFFVFFVASVVRSSALMVLPAPLCRLPAAAVPHQTMKAFLPILVRFAFIVFFASIVVVESLRF